MNLKKFNSLIAIILTVSMIAGCGSHKAAGSANAGDESANISEAADDTAQAAEETASDTSVSDDVYREKSERPKLILKELKLDDSDVKPGVQDFEIAPDFSNVYRFDDFWYSDGELEKLQKNGFMVSPYGDNEFFEMYEYNRYGYIPNFITVDSLMHTYHLYFAYLLKKIEKNTVSATVADLSVKMAENSINQYEELKGTKWEAAAKRNVAFFSVAASIFDSGFEVKDYVKDCVNAELKAINDAKGIEKSSINDSDEDYTQYKPRGYYGGDEQLEKYFKAMMWYGRMHFTQKDEDLDRSALLITKAMIEDDESYEMWKAVYAITSFFTGVSDDAGVAEYAQVLYDAYGTDISCKTLAKNEDAFKQFHKLTENIKVPQINSLPIAMSDETNIIPGFRFMGQRFTIDATIMQKLVYRDVKENSNGGLRMLPDVLDFPAALGNDTALEILEEQGDTDYAGFMDNMNKLRDDFSKKNDELWSASLYASWLNTLRPLLNEDRDGYPQFMRTKAWIKKNLECFAGSYTELKHDTVLYSKQILAEMGGGDIDEWDDRGYVEPEPVVYTRFVNLATQTKEGLKRHNMLEKVQEDDLDKLIEIAKQLKTISEKELRDELPTDEEFDFIREYGGYIEHFWYEIAKEDSQDEYVTTQNYPAALVTDIATDPNGTIRELGTGNTSRIDVIVKVDDKIKIARGSVYSFYQFDWPMDDRLTDKKWWNIIGIDWDMNGYSEDEYNKLQEMKPDKPEWTKEYRCEDDY